MNEQQQIEIIQAHMAGKKVMCQDLSSDTFATLVEVEKGHHRFNFQRFNYRVEPRNVDCFCYLAQGQIDALLREGPATVETKISNGAALKLPQPPYYLGGETKLLVKLTFLEPV
jgi:hypothetical protein